MYSSVLAVCHLRVPTKLHDISQDSVIERNRAMQAKKKYINSRSVSKRIEDPVGLLEKLLTVAIPRHTAVSLNIGKVELSGSQVRLFYHAREACVAADSRTISDSMDWSTEYPCPQPFD